jgi:hypothetical protein
MNEVGSMARGRRLRALAVSCVWIMLTSLAALSGCTENFGPPPPDANRRLPVVAESFAGPVPSRTLLTMEGRSGRWYLGTDRGLYRLESPWAAPRTFPEHGGFTDVFDLTGISSIDEMAVDPSGVSIVFRTRFGSTDFITASVDGGRNYRAVALPNPALQRADALYAWAASARSTVARIAVAQGASLFLRDPGSETWVQASLALNPSSFGPAWQSAEGRLWLAIEIATGWAILRSDDGGLAFADTGLREADAIVALAHDGQSVHWVTGSRWVAGTEELSWPDYRNVAARFLLADDGLHYALLGQNELTAGFALAWGMGFPNSVSASALNFDPVPASLYLGREGVALGESDATLHRFRSASMDDPLAFAGGDLDWGAIAASVEGSQLYLGQARSGVVYRGFADDPASMESLGSPLFQSQPRTLYVEVGPDPGVFAGSFGVHYLGPASVVWQTRDNGQFSYLLENFAGPVKPRVIAAAPDGELWLGSIQGDGPYRSTNSGISWIRVHDGLGEPGSRAAEDGLPGAPEVTAYAFVPEGGGATSTWMSTFRGGVWRLDDGATPFWEQANEGLLDNMGAAVDSCCVNTEEREVDVRDLVVLADGSLLAATANGAFRLPKPHVMWEESSLGLANTDLRALAVDPRSPARVVAVARGSVDNDTWLFFSEDAGLSWIAVGSSLLAKNGVDVVWSRPQRNEVVAILEAQGAWRVELMP